ncbi:MAG: TIGR03960 family B12-binding radical SAM protein, partial [Candidatus Marinimicrobia bacterium]|nr:TIGR03960 family B12-binding radical SAM protein [Candidatus Neomarinimicrobiota bacterium]
SCSYNPEPLIDFVDVFLIGDGEEITVPLFHKIRELKLAGHSRKEILSALNQPEKGLYVPEFYNKESQAPVKAQKVTSLKNDYYPEKPYIPVIDIAQDRFALEIQRGCTEGCRFCQAGMIYRPVRERSADDMMEFSKINLDQSGYEEMSLLSLSTSDYSDLDSFLKKLKPYTDEHHISVSFPSMRLDNISPAILDMAASQRKSGFTFAPEAGSQRLRNVINKNISDDDLYSTVELALKRGWKTLKFYYMLGLPTETDEDLQALVNQIYHIKSLTRPYGKIKINVTLSSFIPKAFTPFQWERQCSTEELQDKIDFIKGKIHVKNINLKSRDPETTLIEGILARGGAECGTLIHNAWASGAKFDAWKDKFNSNIWRNALEDAKTQTEEILKERSEKDSLPWDFIDTGITKEYLLEEMKNAVQEKTTKDCRDGCTTCGVCDFKELKMDIATPTSDIPDTAKTTPEEVETPLENRRLYRLKFSKTGKLRYAGHHDLFR